MSVTIDYSKLRIHPDPDTREWWEATRKRKYLVRQCNLCGHKWFPPNIPACSKCTSMDIGWFETAGKGIESVRVGDQITGQTSTMKADAFVAAMGSFTAPLLRPLGIYLNIYPAKGYSTTLKLKHPDQASVVSMIDDARKIAISRLGDTIRIAGTAEMAGYDTTLTSRTSRLRCEALVRRYEELFPGVADASEPNFWAGLRPSTPNNIPVIGRSKLRNLWMNAGHGTLGWTHGAGSGRALAELMSGKRPALNFGFAAQTSAVHPPQVKLA